MNKKKKLKFGMVGGGPGSYIGPIHRLAAQLDGEMELVCGAFSSEPEKSYKMGLELQLDPEKPKFLQSAPMVPHLG